MSDASRRRFEELIARCTASNGDQAAWNELFRLLSPFVHHWALHYLNGGTGRISADSQANDLCMEVWVRLLRSDRKALRAFRGSSQPAFHAYLKSMLQNLVIDLSRRGRAKGRDNVRPLDQDELPRIEDPDLRSNPLQRVMEIDLSEKAKAHLYATWRHKPTCTRDLLIFSLHFEDGMSAARIAGIGSIGLARGGVEKVIERIRACLRDLADDGEAEASA